MIYSHHIIPDCELMKIIYVHCCLRNEYESDLHSNKPYLGKGENKA